LDAQNGWRGIYTEQAWRPVNLRLTGAAWDGVSVHLSIHICVIGCILDVLVI
jgi:hypothetical protein